MTTTSSGDPAELPQRLLVPLVALCVDSFQRVLGFWVLLFSSPALSPNFFRVVHFFLGTEFLS